MATFLLPAPPMAMGTSDIEALDSYLDRLAAVHGVAPFTFCRLLDSWWERTKPEGSSSLGRYIAHVPKCGYGRDIAQLVEVLEKGTGFQGLASMTLMAFSEVSGRYAGDIVRHVHHWCPACMEEWKRSGTPAHEKLLWRLKPISRCHIHRLQLENRCPHCSAAQARKNDRPWFRCSNCFDELCSDTRSWKLARSSTPGEKDLVEVVGFCAANPSFVFKKDSPHRFFRATKRELDGKRLSQSAGDYFHKRDETTRKLIGSLLRIAQRFQTPLTDILVDPQQAAAARPLEGLAPKPLSFHPAMKAYDHLVRERVRQELEVALRQGLEGKSLACICREVGISHNAVSKWFPPQVKALVEHQKRLREHQRDRDLARLQSISFEDLLTPEMQAVGWHRIPNVIAERWSVSVYIARKRVSVLREATSKRRSLAAESKPL